MFWASVPNFIHFSLTKKEIKGAFKIFKKTLQDKILKELKA
jgi:hypothetical protein